MSEVKVDYLKVKPRGETFTIGDLRRALRRAEALGVVDDEEVRVDTTLRGFTFAGPVQGVAINAFYLPVSAEDDA
jgi:hypothetical protein